MNVQPITIQTFVSGAWHSAASIRFPVAGVTQVTYLNDYLEQHIESFGASDQHAICEAYPLDFGVWKAKDWPALILDIMPSGAARRWWKRQLSVQDKTEREFDFELLRDYTSSPIGHLRVLESIREYVEPIAFSKDEVVLRDTGFLEYAAELGAALGGATGAGGDAPKVLLVEDAQATSVSTFDPENSTIRKMANPVSGFPDSTATPPQTALSGSPWNRSIRWLESQNPGRSSLMRPIYVASQARYNDVDTKNE